jgi:hypothetical protein
VAKYPQRIFGIGLREAGHEGKARSADPINNAEIQPFRKRSLFSGNAGGIRIEDLRGRRFMKVFAGNERFDEIRVARKIRKNTELDLRIVRDNKFPAIRSLEAAPVGFLMRDLLEIWI